MKTQTIIAALRAAAAALLRDEGPQEVQAGPLAATMDLHTMEDARGIDHVTGGALYVGQEGVSATLLHEYEDDLLRAGATRLGRRLHWVDRSWDHHGGEWRRHFSLKP